MRQRSQNPLFRCGPRFRNLHTTFPPGKIEGNFIPQSAFRCHAIIVDANPPGGYDERSRIIPTQRKTHNDTRRGARFRAMNWGGNKMQDDSVSAGIPQERLQKKVAWLSIRWLIALSGLTLLVIGQFRLASEKPSEAAPEPIGVWLNEQIHLGDPDIDNVLNGLPVFLTGGVLLAVALRG